MSWVYVRNYASEPRARAVFVGGAPVRRRRRVPELSAPSASWCTRLADPVGRETRSRLMAPSANRIQAGHDRGHRTCEQRSAAMYTSVAAAASGKRPNVLAELAAVEHEHAANRAGKLTEAGEQVPHPTRPRALNGVRGWLARQVSIAAVLPLLEGAAFADAVRYQHDADATVAMAIGERSPARVLTRLRESERMDGPRSIAQRERRHRRDRSGALRAAVFGVNDGLVSNTALVMGFSGSGAS